MRLREDFIADELVVDVLRESRAAARATVRVTKRRVMEESTIQQAWLWYLRNRDAADIPFAAVVARCPGVDPARVRVGFERRFRARRSIPTSSA